MQKEKPAAPPTGTSVRADARSCEPSDYLMAGAKRPVSRPVFLIFILPVMSLSSVNGFGRLNTSPINSNLRLLFGSPFFGHNVRVTRIKSITEIFSSGGLP